MSLAWIAEMINKHDNGYLTKRILLFVIDKNVEVM